MGKREKRIRFIKEGKHMGLKEYGIAADKE